MNAWRQISEGMIHQPQCPEDWDLDQQFAHHENLKPTGAKDVTLDLWYFEHEQHGDPETVVRIQCATIKIN